MRDSTKIERNEEAGITRIEDDGTKIVVYIYDFNETAKIESHDSGDKIYFKSIEEVELLRDLLNELLVENPIIKPR